MVRDYFWLTEAQFGCIQPFFRTDTRGVKRVDDRRVVSGIVHVLKSGGRWIDTLEHYGPRKTHYNRFVHWVAKRVWIDMFHTLAAGRAAELLLLAPSLPQQKRHGAHVRPTQGLPPYRHWIRPDCNQLACRALPRRDSQL